MIRTGRNSSPQWVFFATLAFKFHREKKLGLIQLQVAHRLTNGMETLQVIGPSSLLKSPIAVILAL